MFKFSPNIAVNVKKYSEAVAFYRDILGFEVVKQTEKETHFKKGELNFFIEENETNPRQVFFEFEVEDFKEAETKLLAEGCVITSPYSERNKMFSDKYGLNFHVYEKGVELPGCS